MVLAVQMKNCDPLVFGPALAIDSVPAAEQQNSVCHVSFFPHSPTYYIYSGKHIIYNRICDWIDPCKELWNICNGQMHSTNDNLVILSLLVLNIKLNNQA